MYNRNQDFNVATSVIGGILTGKFISGYYKTGHYNNLNFKYKLTAISFPYLLGFTVYKYILKN